MNIISSKLIILASSFYVFAFTFQQTIIASHDATTFRFFESQSQQYNNSTFSSKENNSTGKRRMAIARTFCEADAMDLVRSFDAWDEFTPCKHALESPVDLVVAFSQFLEKSPIAREAIKGVEKRFRETRGWNGCFERLIAYGTNIPPHLDSYKSEQQGIDMNWVSGPNRQFERTIRYIGALDNYELMYLMEGDSVPLKPYWLDAVVSEVNQMRPFAVLGSSYKGDKWDQFFDKLPSSLIHHTNGNAIYNISHPFFLNLLSELESEAKTAANNIAFDHRMTQIIQEGIIGYPSEQTYFPEAEPLPDRTTVFQQWIEQYPPETVMKQSLVNGNYAATNMVRELVDNNAFVIHGAKMYKSWNSTVHGDLTLVISDWSEGNSRQLLSPLDDSRHPFSRVLIMQPDKTLDDSTQTMVPVQRYGRGIKPDFMDFCTAPVSTDWFMLTNSYFKLRPIVTVMVHEKKKGHFKPVVSTVEADETTCFSYDSCVKDLQVAQEFLPNMKKIFQSDNMVFRTSSRDKFCDRLASLNLWANITAAPVTAYMAYIEAEEGGIDSVYKLSDRRKHGSRFQFAPLHEDVLPPIMAGNHRRNRQLQAVLSNETECTSLLSDIECSSNGCVWNADFASCRDSPILDDNLDTNLDNSTDDGIISKSDLNNSSLDPNTILSEQTAPYNLTAEFLQGMQSGNFSEFLEIIKSFNEGTNTSAMSPSFANFISNISNAPGFNADFNGNIIDLFGNMTTFNAIFGNISNFASLFGVQQPPTINAPTQQPAAAPETLQVDQIQQEETTAESVVATDAPISDDAPIGNNAPTPPPTDGPIEPPPVCKVHVMVEGKQVETIDIPCP